LRDLSWLHWLQRRKRRNVLLASPYTSVSPSFISVKRVSFRVLSYRVVLQTTDLVSNQKRNFHLAAGIVTAARERASARSGGENACSSGSLRYIELDAAFRSLRDPAPSSRSPTSAIPRTIALCRRSNRLSRPIGNARTAIVVVSVAADAIPGNRGETPRVKRAAVPSIVAHPLSRE